MIGNGGSQISRYYIWVSNIWKYIIYKSIRMVSYFGLRYIGYQTMKMLIYKNCLDWHRFILHLVMDQNYNENIGFYLLYTLFILHTTHYSRVKYNHSRELLIMMIIINVLQVIINHVKVVNMYESHYQSYYS